MEKVGMNMIEIILLIGLIYGVIRYWKWKLEGGYDLTLENLSYATFLGGQILCVLLLLIGSVDEQILIYMEGLNLFGAGAFSFWTILGIQLFGIVFLYMLSLVFTHLLYNVTLKKEFSIYNEFRNKNFGVALIISIISISICIVAANYVLKPFLFDWIMTRSKLVPMV